MWDITGDPAVAGTVARQIMKDRVREAEQRRLVRKPAVTRKSRDTAARRRPVWAAMILRRT